MNLYSYYLHCLLLNYHSLPWCVTITFSGWILQSIWHLNLVPRVYKIGMVLPWASVWSSNYIWSPKDVVESCVKRGYRIVRFGLSLRYYSRKTYIKGNKCQLCKWMNKIPFVSGVQVIIEGLCNTQFSVSCITIFWSAPFMTSARYKINM